MQWLRRAWTGNRHAVRWPLLALGLWAFSVSAPEPVFPLAKTESVAPKMDRSWWDCTHESPKKPANRVLQLVERLSGPYARLVLQAARVNHISARLIAAVIQVENGGNFVGSATRVSSAGAIGVMQLEPVTATEVLHVNAWKPRQNIEGGARFLAMLLHEFHNTRLALMAYNAGPTWIAQGGRPEQAVVYAAKVLRYARA